MRLINLDNLIERTEWLQDEEFNKYARVKEALQLDINAYTVGKKLQNVEINVDGNDNLKKLVQEPEYAKAIFERLLKVINMIQGTPIKLNILPGQNNNSSIQVTLAYDSDDKIKFITLYGGNMIALADEALLNYIDGKCKSKTKVFKGM